MDPVTGLLVASALAILAILLALTTLLGAVVAIWPGLLARMRGATDRRYSLRRATGPLDRPRNVDRWFYRHHRAYGVIVMSMALFLLYFLAFGEMRSGWSAIFGREYREVAVLVAEAARIVLWIMAAFALIIGTIVFARPSALKALEKQANRWLTPRRYTRGLDREYTGIDSLLAGRPRLWGVLVFAASAACLVALLMQWRVSGLAG